MSERERAHMSDEELEKMLRSELPGLPPPDEIVSDVTPWRRASDRVFAGLALTMLTLNFLGLNYILPAIGMVLMLLGLRTLRRENGWFKACFVLTVVRAVQFFAVCILNTALYMQAVNDGAVGTVLTWLSAAMGLAGAVCLWQALSAVRRKAGLEGGAKAGGAVVAWYVFVLILAAVKYEGIIIAAAMIISYILIIRGLVKLSRELEQTGYAIEPSPARVSDKTLVIAVALTLIVGVICGYTFGTSYKMDWQSVSEASQEQTEIKSHLLELGFPQDVLDDLSSEDIAKLESAEQVVSEPPEDISVRGDNAPAVTHAAVRLSEGERERWIVIHHFCWDGSRSFNGTECIQLWPTYRDVPEGWSSVCVSDDDSAFGRVLYTKDGTDYAAPFWYLGAESYVRDTMFWGKKQTSDIFAAFSGPRHAERLRGYVAYETLCSDPSYIFSSWMNYFHQQTLLQYPVMSAMECCKNGSAWTSGGAFSLTQYALQFYRYDDGSIELIS